MSQGDLLRVLLILLLLTISGLFAAAEIGLLGAAGGRRTGRPLTGLTGALMERLLARPATTLGAILVVITALNYASEAMAAGLFISRGLPVWPAIVAMVVLVMVCAEAVPISYAAANTDRVAWAFAAPVWVVTWLLSVPARAVGFLAERLVHLLGAKPRREEPVTEEEIKTIVDLQAETGGLEEEEKAMIHHIFEFGDKTAREVMVPRTAMVAIAETTAARQAARVVTEARISRLPVYRDDLDDIAGMVYVRDLLPLLASGQGDLAVRSVMRPAFRVPETKRLSDLLTDFRRQRRSLAIVTDEYGGTAGVVTLEDLLEEVVGDIYDEYDLVRPAVQRLESGAIALDGSMSVEEASAALGVPLPEGDYSTLGGLVYHHLGAVPRAGQALELPGLRLIIDALEGYRILRVLVLRRPEPGAEGGLPPRDGAPPQPDRDGAGDA